MHKVTNAFSDGLKELKEQYDNELKMAGATIVMGVAVPSVSRAVEENDFELLTKVIVGSSDNVDKAILKLLKLMKDAK